MKINGFDKLTLLDFPGLVAAIVFTKGCNYKCSFCHNSDLIDVCGESLYSEDEILEYLLKRKKVLDGVVISGGEPTLQKDLPQFIKKIKNMGYKVKLDTNGTNPKMLKELINAKLLDYIAMDIKATFDDYEKVVKVKNFFLNNIKESIKIIQESNTNHEFRTTIMKNFHNENKILEIASYTLNSKYYLQNFIDSKAVLDKNLISFSKEELQSISENIKKKYPNASVRGI